jgi:hypothetical protein
MSLAPHQERVVNEHAELADKVTKLYKFITEGNTFPPLPAAERERLIRQYGLMKSYAAVLLERIAAF